MTERRVLGIWLGKRFLSDERLVGIEDGSVCVSSSVRLMPDSESWSVEWVNKILGTPWRPKGSGPGSEEDTAVEVIPAGNPLDVGHPQPRKQRQEGAPREVYITKEHIVKFGYTASCLKRRAMREGFQVTRGHSSLCRERIMEALRSDEDSKELLEKAEEKNQRFLARQVEDAEREAKKRKLNESRLAKAISYVPDSSPATISPSTEGASSSSTSRMPVEKQKRTDEAADSEEETKRRKREEENRASTKRELEGEASAPPTSRRKSDLELKKLARAATDAGLARARTEADKRRRAMDEQNQSKEDHDVKMEEARLLKRSTRRD